MRGNLVFILFQVSDSQERKSAKIGKNSSECKNTRSKDNSDRIMDQQQIVSPAIWDLAYCRIMLLVMLMMIMVMIIGP